MNKRKSKVSIKDIAEELNISTTTISFIINKKAKNRISDEVIKKVEDYIEEVGYIPNSSAQSLRTGKSKTILYMVEDISDPFFSSIAKEMEEIAFENGYKIIYCSTENKKERALQLLSYFKDKQIDAFIITPPDNFEDEINKLISENHKVVLFDRHYEKSNHSYVVLDNYKSSKLSVEHLLQKGFKNIAFIGMNTDLSVIKEREEGYKHAINNIGGQNFIMNVKFGDIKSSKAKSMIEAYLDENKNIDAILFASNKLAILGLSVLKSKKINIPDDIGVATFDDRELFEHHTPSISVLRQPVSLLAKELMNNTLRLLEKQSNSNNPFNIALQGKFISRESTNRVVAS